MTDDLLLPGWRDRLAAAGPGPAATFAAPPLSRGHFAGRVEFVADPAAAALMVQLAYEAPIAAIGIDAEYRFDRDRPLALGRNRPWFDVRGVRPFCLALAMVSEERAFRFVVDLRLPDLLPAVQAVLDLPVPFAAHHAKAEFFALWSLGLREPRTVWDTLVAEKALRLGRSPGRARARRAPTVAESRRLRDDADAAEGQSLALDPTAARHGIDLARPGPKEALQESFLAKPYAAPLTATEVEYCATDAWAAAAIRSAQRGACDRAGIGEALDRVVMPWVVTAAEIEWTGVRFDRPKCRAFLDAATQARARIGAELRGHGLANPNSAAQLGDLLVALGLGRHFPPTRGGRPCTKDDVLAALEHLHPAIRLTRLWRKVGTLAADPAVLGLIDGADGRVHADLRVLGADTGRTQARCPNLMGIGKAFRPLVRAPEGRAIGEVDLAQIEVGIAAALFRDPAMIADFNGGDVYAGTARRVFADQIRPGDERLPDREFRARYAPLRARTKPLVLGIIYGKSIGSIAAELGIDLAAARALWDAFRRLYPTLCDGMERARAQSVRRGYAYVSGLRRFRAGAGPATGHEQRGLGNAYVQGTAALVFFDAGNRLRPLLRQYQSTLILAVHDAYVFEAPAGLAAEVAELVRSVLVRTVQEWFPELRPRAEVNVAHPHCWNHEGRHDSVERFLEDPLRHG